MDYMSQSWRILFEAVPLALAFGTLILSLFSAVTNIDDTHRRITAWLFFISAALLIFAQSSWSWTIFIKKDLLGTDFANVVWTLFNGIVMSSMLYALKGPKK